MGGYKRIREGTVTVIKGPGAGNGWSDGDGGAVCRMTFDIFINHSGRKSF